MYRLHADLTCPIVGLLTNAGKLKIIVTVCERLVVEY